MIEPQKRNAIFLLHQEGMSVRQIARALGISRNTVRAIIAQRGATPHPTRENKIAIDPDLLRRLHAECDGFAKRVHERLVEEEGVQVTYSTLTRMLRDLGIGWEGKPRCDRVPDEPGAEMQHDTSPHTVQIEGRSVKVITSVLYLRYSKRRYVRFYRRFNRFTMKSFLHEALTFWGYSAPRCIIDNTNLARLRGSGKHAVIVPEMEAFSKQYGFEFVCHEIKHANRKAGNERSFYTVETNFFPGRTFESLADMNEQGKEWANVRMFHRPISRSGLIPVKLFEVEQPSLVELPAHLPPPYLVHDRLTDQYGYAALGGNFFWVPGTKRDPVKVLEYGERLQIYRRREQLIEYELPDEGVRNKRFSPPGQPKPRYAPKNRKKPTAVEEQRLRAIGDPVGAWLDFALEPRGIARHRFVRAVFKLSQQMTPSLFLRCVERAFQYRIRSVEILRNIALMTMSEGLEALPDPQVDESFTQRASYEEGRLSDNPDLSALDRMWPEQEPETEDETEHEGGDEQDHG